MNEVTVKLVHCPGQRSYRADTPEAEQMLSEEFAMGVMDECPPRAILIVTRAWRSGTIRILSTDLGWHEIVFAQDTFWLRPFLSREFRGSLDFQLWVHARHRICPALAKLLERVAEDRDQLWLQLEPASDNQS